MFFLDKDSSNFPAKNMNQSTDLFAVGGNLSSSLLLNAYKKGIFPWYEENQPILWWFPKQRFILYPSKIHISKSMKRTLNKNTFQISYNKSFKKVITKCRETRIKTEGTWITKNMLNSYCKLHEQGYAHSVEAWHNNKLVGGIYGIALGKCFFGESMFSTMPNASKATLINLCKKLSTLNFILLDCQVYSSHLESLGAITIQNSKFIKLINKAMKIKNLKNHWYSKIPLKT